jgi:hypothetical protein
MDGRPDPARSPEDPTAGAFNLVSFLGQFLESPGPKFFMIVGPVGSGKSTLLRSLIPGLSGPKLFLAYQIPAGSSPSAQARGETPPPVPLLLVEPRRDSSDRSPPRDPTSSSILAFNPQAPGEDSAPLAPVAEAMGRLAAAGNGVVVVDSWDRGSDLFFRAQANATEDVQTLSAPAAAVAQMQSTLVSTPVHVLLGITPELGLPLLSLADAVVSLHEEVHTEGRLRVATVTKIRGAQPPLADYLYTLQGGRFRALPGFSSSFRPPVAPADPDSDPSAHSLWPGSASWAQAFGRLRPGGLTAVTLSSECPATIPHAIAAPIAIHTLRYGGRVVWVPAPSIRPSQIVSLLSQFVPADAMHARLRILSASGHDPALGEMDTVIFPLDREDPVVPGPKPPGTSGVRPLFERVHQFFRDPAESPASVLIGSFEGLRAVASAVGLAIDASTIPVVLGGYTRLPNFHLFSSCDRADPVVAHLRPGVDTLAEIDMVHGRPVLFGIRPRTTPFLLDWSDPTGRYSLVPVA